jgi:hypothetical protein
MELHTACATMDDRASHDVPDRVSARQARDLRSFEGGPAAAAGTRNG